MGGSVYTIKSEDLQPFWETFNGNAAIIVPFGIGIVVAFAAIKFVPKLIKTFAKG